MKTCLLLFISLAYSVTTASQEPIYKCRFTDSIGVLDYSSVISSIRKSLMEKNMPPDAIDKYISIYFNNPSSLSIVQERIVNAYADSSVIVFNYDSHANDRIILELPGNKLLVKNGQLFRYNVGLGTYSTSSISDSSQTFISTGSQKEIFGFICEEYISIDSIYKIWVTDKLPDTINPGINIKNIRGAILGFEAKTGNGYTRGMLSKIEKAKTVI